MMDDAVKDVGRHQHQRGQVADTRQVEAANHLAPGQVHRRAVQTGRAMKDGELSTRRLHRFSYCAFSDGMRRAADAMDLTSS